MACSLYCGLVRAAKDTYDGKYCPSANGCMGKWLFRTENNVTEFGYHFFSSPPALKGAGYPFPAE